MTVLDATFIEALPTVIIFPETTSNAAQRSRRGAQAQGLKIDEAITAPSGWLWLLRAGTWPIGAPLPLASASGRPTALLGMAIPAEPDAEMDESALHWDAWRRNSGGDADRAAIPGIPSAVLLDPELSFRWRTAVNSGANMEAALAELLHDQRVRRVHWAGADVWADLRLRVAQVITSVQRGGAERVALDLHRTLHHHRIATRFIVAGNPVRGAFALPQNALNCASDGSRSARMAQAAKYAAQLGADIVHAHLLTAEDLESFVASKLPLLITVHNAQPGWPAGLADMRSRSLLVACSRRVEAELANKTPHLPRRTVWNGIDAATTAPTTIVLQRGQALRRRLHIEVGDVVLVALANPRAQKRLEILPALTAPLQQNLNRRVHILLAGEAGVGPGAAEVEVIFLAQVDSFDVSAFVHRLGMVEDVAAVFAAADVLVSPSAWEGLSLAHLEALAAGIPVVSSDVGGAAEVAFFHPQVHLVAVDAEPSVWITQLTQVLSALPPRISSLHPAFTTAGMTRGYARLYPRALALHRHRIQPDGLWLVINNLCSGGAQSSARRLLTLLHNDGIRVRCAVLQEKESMPSAGRTALKSAGISLLVLPPPDELDAEYSTARLAEAIEADPPQAVLLWNVMPRHKLLLSEILIDTPLWDISPGEMNFASMARVFSAPLVGLSMRNALDYGARLAGAIVKFQGEAQRAADVFGVAVQVIPNGVPLVSQVIHCNEPRSPGRFVFGTSARLSPDKRLEDLFAALRLASTRLPPWELHVAGGSDGDPSYGERLRLAVSDLPIYFLGELSDSSELLTNIDAFVLIAEPAGCPNASLEAMAHGVPVVATDVGGMCEQIEHRISGLLVPPRDAVALAVALVEITQDPMRRAQWGAAGRMRVETYFTVERMAADYRRICLSS